jgi:hypothetical protein
MYGTGTVLSAAPSFIFWWPKSKILFDPFPRSSPFTGWAALTTNANGAQSSPMSMIGYLYLFADDFLHNRVAYGDFISILTKMLPLSAPIFITI